MSCRNRGHSERTVLGMNARKAAVRSKEEASIAAAPRASTRRSGTAAGLNFLSLEAAAFERLARGERAAAAG